MNEAFETVIEKTTIKTTEEVENMVRKAETLKSIDELNLSKRTCSLIEKKFGSDVQKAIGYGRYFMLPYDPEREFGTEYMQEFVEALDEAGFIRHDIDLRAWNVWSLYRVAFGKQILLSGITTGQDLIDREDFSFNGDYETMSTVSDDDFNDIMSVLETLSEREQKVLELRFGLDGKKPQSLEAVSRYFNVTRERVKQIETKAIRKLRHPSRKSNFPSLFGFVPPEELSVEYHVLDNGSKVADLDSAIAGLDFSIRTYNCLMRAHICTIADILNLPKEDWLKVRNLGRRSLDEVVEKMHAVGYPEFSVDLS